MFPFQNVSDIPRWQQLQCQEQHQLTKHTVSFKNIEKSEKKDFISGKNDSIRQKNDTKYALIAQPFLGDCCLWKEYIFTEPRSAFVNFLCFQTKQRWSLPRLDICQKIYRTEDFRVKNLHRKRVIFDIC